MFFPIGDDNIRGGHKPLFSYSFIALNVVIFLIQFITPGNLVCEFAAIPGDIVQGKNWINIFTSTFMHGGWMHLAGNMMFLWIFADNIEGTVGNVKFVVFYMLGGLFASLAHIFFSLTPDEVVSCCKICDTINPCLAGMTPCGAFVPSLGASGAISAVMGAYLVMFTQSRIKMLSVFGIFKIPAFIFLLFWIGQQLFSGIGSLGPASGGGVAWWAHIGGFFFGLFAGWVFRPMVGKHPGQGQSSYV